MINGCSCSGQNQTDMKQSTIFNEIGHNVSCNKSETGPPARGHFLLMNLITAGHENIAFDLMAHHNNNIAH